MSDITTTDAVSVLLEREQKPLRDVFLKRTILGQVIKPRFGSTVGASAGDTANAGKVSIPVRTEPNYSFGGVIGDGERATAGAGSYDEMTVTVYPHNGTCKFGMISDLRSKAALKTAQGILKRATEDLMSGFPLNLNMIWSQYGTGSPAQVESVTDSNTLVIKADGGPGSATGNGLRYLRKGMRFAFTSDLSATYPDRNAVASITGITASTRAVDWKGALTGVVADDFLVIPDGLNNVSNGLLSIDPAYKSVYMGVDRSVAANDWATPVTKSLASLASLEDAIIETCLEADADGDGAGDLGITNRETYMHLWSEIKDKTRFVKGGGKYEIGFSSINVSTKDGRAVQFFLDENMPGSVAADTGFMMIIRPQDWFFARAGEPGWFKLPGSNQMWSSVGRGFMAEATWLDIHDLECEGVRNQILIKTIQA